MSLNTTSVLNSIAATAADFSLSAQNFSITGAPVIRYGDIASAGNGFLFSLTATRARKSMTFTAANNTTYSFRIKQTVAGVDKSSLITYTSDSSGSAAEIIAAITAQLAALQFDITVTGSSSPIYLAASSTNPLFTITDVTNVVTAAAMDTSTASVASGTGLYLTAVISIAGTTTVTITSTAHGLSVGQYVTVTILTGGGTLDGAASVTARVGTVPTADTFTLINATTGANVVGSGTFTTYSAVVVAQAPRGTYAQLVADGITGATAGNTYTSLGILWNNKVADALGVDSQATSRLHTVYFNDTDADFQALVADITLKLKGYTTGTTPNVAAFNQLPL